METTTAENYLKALYRLCVEERAGTASTGDLARLLRITPGSVTGMLQRLAQAELVEYAPHQGAQLSKRGKKAALGILRRHRLLELFLVKTLGMTWDEVHEEAEHLEHSASDRLVERIDQFLGYPDRDPHGDPIPDAKGRLRATEGETLVSCVPGTMFQLLRVRQDSTDLLRYLNDADLRPGATATVVSNELAAGVLEINVGGRTISLGRQAAHQILVRTLRPPPARPT